jgi:putative peptidoglycan lipid II flippase
MRAMSPRRALARRFGGALAVGVGIFLSRIAGLVRERVLAHYLGRSDEAGAFRAALRIPNFLQNLLGEGVLSAAFIPVYTRLRAEGKRRRGAGGWRGRSARSWRVVASRGGACSASSLPGR